MKCGFGVYDAIFFDHVIVALGDDKPQRRCVIGNLRWKKNLGFILTGVKCDKNGTPEFHSAAANAVDVWPISASLAQGSMIDELSGQYFCDLQLQFQGSLKISEKFAERLTVKKFDLSKYNFEIVSGGISK